MIYKRFWAALSLMVTVCICVIDVFAITRDEVIAEAERYTTREWNVVTPNPIYEIYSREGARCRGMAYSFGNKDTIPQFLQKIADGRIPRNWANVRTWFPVNPPRCYAGIDCSGLVCNCYRILPHEGTWGLSRRGRAIDWEELKRGDIIVRENIGVKPRM